MVLDVQQVWFLGVAVLFSHQAFPVVSRQCHIWTLCLVALVVLTAVSSAQADNTAVASQEEPRRELGRDPFATYPFLVELGERGYVIPRNYIQKITYLAPGRPLERVVMRLLWPGLEPLTQENRHHWKRREPDKQITVHIVRRGRDGYRGLQGGIDEGLFRRHSSAYELHGLVMYRWNYYRRFLSTDTDFLTPNGTPLVFTCNDTDDETKARFDFEPICRVEYWLSDGVGLYYRFFMVNLAQWREIDTAVRALVDSFRR